MPKGKWEERERERKVVNMKHGMLNNANKTPPVHITAVSHNISKF